MGAAVAASLLLLVSCGARGQGVEQSSRVLVLALDGVDPRAIDRMIDEGELPNFEKLRQEGAHGPLRSQDPLISPVVWTTIATGKPPSEHGITSFTTAGQKEGADGLVTSDQRRVKALWNIFSDEGRSVAVVGWWATWPAEAVRGHIVTDRVAYHFLTSEGLQGKSPPDGLTHPPELAVLLTDEIRRPADVDFGEISRFADVSRGDLEGSFDFEDEVSHLRWALSSAWTYRDLGLRLWRRERPELEMVYIEATDSVSHLFGHLHRQEGLEGDLAAQQRRFGGTVSAIYREADALVGRFMDELDPRTTLVVLSDHGFELGTLHEDPRHARDLRRVSSRFHSPDGILFLYGHRVRPGTTVENATITDIAPTLLSLAGLAPGCDMPGRVLVDAFEMDGPPQCIESHEDRGPPRPDGVGEVADAATEETLTAHLRALGYLGSGSVAEETPGDRVLAMIHFDEGRHAEAARLYGKLLEADPDDARLETGLGAVLGAMGNYGEALRHLDRAVAIDPLNPVAHYNRGLLYERRGEEERAIEEYRRALRFAPELEPARGALARLTGRHRAHPPSSPGEEEADRLATNASLAAKRGAYGLAMELLDQAEEAAPDYPLVHQHRSNVAYLMRDLETAEDALGRALELEPDNELYRTNLKRLRREMEAAPRRTTPSTEEMR